jgi:hypothetical protein
MSTNLTGATLAAVVVSAALAAGASASPGAGSIASSDGSSIYKVSPDRGATIVSKIRGSDRRAVATRRLPGTFELPTIADVASGLSHDGRTLVLAAQPSAHATQFALLDTRTLRVRRTVSLRGDYSFDAMSPDASTLYVIRYLSSDGTHYAVQALDLTDSRPAAETVVEKGEPGEEMTGLPLARATSPDAGWVYTLYDGAGNTPFVHALSTVDRFTVCIDLHALAGRSTAGLDLKLRPQIDKLEVRMAGTPVSVIQTDTFEVTNPPQQPKRIAEAAAQDEDNGSSQWWPAVGVALTAGLVLTAAARRKKTNADPRGTKEPTVRVTK